MRRSTVAWAGFAALFLFSVATLSNAPAFLNNIGQEEVQWINGDDFGYPDRLLQIWLFTRVLPALSGSLLFPYLLPILAHHLLNTLLVAALFTALFSRSLGTGSARLGGLAAGTFFATTRIARGTLGYISALAYTQVTTFCLLAAMAAVRYFRRPTMLRWAVVILCVEATLLCHSYGLLLPPFLLLMEGALTRWRAWSLSRVRFVARHAATHALALAHVLTLWNFYYAQGIKETVGRAGVTDYLGELLRYVLDLSFTFFPGAGYDLGARQQLLPFFAVILFLLAAAAIYLIRVRPGRLPGIPEAGLIFFLGWCGMSFVPLMHFYWGRSDTVLYAADHRMYLNTAGLAIFLAALISWRPGSGPAKGAARAQTSGLITVALVAAWLLLSLDRPLFWLKSLAADLPANLVQDACRGEEGHLPGRQMAARNMHGADFRGADLPGACAALSDLSSARLGGANLSGASFQQALMFGADLGKARAPAANFRAANMTEVILTGGTLSSADFTDTNLRGAMLDGAILKRAILRGADLRKANLRGADLRGADLRGADLRGADLSGADLQGALRDVM